MTQKTKSNPGLLLLLIGYFGFVVIGLPGGTLNVAWEYIERTFERSLSDVGVLLLVATVSAPIVSFLSVPLIARLGAGRFLLIGSVLMGIGLLGFTQAPVWALLILANVFVGMGTAMIDIGTNVFVTVHYNARYLNWLHACFGIGQTLGPALTTVLVITMDQSWRWVYAAIAFSAFTLALMLFSTRKRWRAASGAIQDAEDAEGQKASASETLRVPMAWLGMALFFLYAGVELGTPQLGNSLFVDARGIAPETAGFWISAYWFIFTVGRVVFGVVVAHVDNVRLLRLCMLGMLAGALLIWWNPVDVVSFAGLVLAGFTSAPIFATLLSVTPSRVGARHASNTVGFQVGAASLGIALMPGLGGMLADRFGRPVIAPFLVVITLLMLLVHEGIIWRARAQTQTPDH